MQKLIFLDSPSTQKQILTLRDKNIVVTTIEMQGWRNSMQDRNLSCIDIGDGNGLFAIFDGHGGKQVSTFLSVNFLSFLKKSQEYKKKNYKQALVDVFIQLDQRISSQQGERQLIQIKNQSLWDRIFSNKKSDKKISQICGSTANVILITPKYFYIANAGDSRSVLVRDKMCIDLSHDHKPNNKDQCDRIVKAGGKVIKNRINGRLNVSRGFGDFQFKNNNNIPLTNQMLICLPQVFAIKRDFVQDKYILMGCDGIWQCSQKSSKNLIKSFNKKLKQLSRQKALQKLFDQNLGQKRSKHNWGYDNMTAIYIQLNDQKTCSQKSKCSSKQSEI